ncbi:1,3-beta-glucan synthase component FKS1 [Zychaea mexicana]|uniref:1,3-beta-glucan synthase component FKS1 n=1 Tax=Zychaea mexicana TaxID=64656 RepID=UPI0022FF2C27|nr:1,3-beta-glucan synthase component FKS1 [Zychaea mexicana]KAI9499623.1 1,3-beta-glucan synthase component FKS1 [Zychaea mexicana]
MPTSEEGDNDAPQDSNPIHTVRGSTMNNASNNRPLSPSSAYQYPSTARSNASLETGSSIPTVRDPSRGYDVDFYGHVRDDIHNSGRYFRYAPSTDSLVAQLETKRHRAPTRLTTYGPTAEQCDNGVASLSNDTLVGGSGTTNGAAATNYASWNSAVPCTADEIQQTFVHLTNAFGFQLCSMQNMYDHLMIMLDSRSSRMSPLAALHTLHAEYIGGPDANYRQWYFAAQQDIDGETNNIENGVSTLVDALEAWMNSMEGLSNIDRIQQLALWLLIWGEASNLRFCPEALCFIFKCANDAYKPISQQQTMEVAPEGDFLNSVIQPLYDFIREQSYRADGQKRERDHAEIIGYDDVNQLFWSQDTIAKLKLQDKSKLMDLPAEQRYHALRDVRWVKAFSKTFKEKRSWMHLAINFTRVWIIHVVAFWYYISANAGALYLSTDKDEAEKEVPVQLSIVALGGSVATLIVLLACLVEYVYVPMSWNRAGILMRRFTFLVPIFLLNTAPSVYCLMFDRTSPFATAISVIQLLISIASSVFFAVTPQSRLFLKRSQQDDKRKALVHKTFTANFPQLRRMDRATSMGLWACVFGCKLLESYFFLALSFKDSLTAMARMQVKDCSDPIIGSALCAYMPMITLAFMTLMELILFFLDTYLWYVVWNTMFSVAHSFYLGISIWTPWRNIFSRLPRRIHAKILAVSELNVQCKPRALCSQVWNAFIIAMYRDHLLSADHVAKLLYQQVSDISDSQKTSLEEPTFFVAQEDIAYENEYYPQHSEAERRVQFFAQSLTTPMPEPLPVPNMPTFTVLTPHCGEKILLTLREIIREEDQNTRITLLEYLKRLHPFEWDNFVKDTKILADEAIDTTLNAALDSSTCEDGRSATSSERTHVHKDTDDLPFYCVGFKSSAPEYTLRTRIWASLRSQTLYRTVSGFMNYDNAIKLLYRVEQPDVFVDEKKTDLELDQMVHRKFRLVLAMQRYASFNYEERESTEVLLKAYPNLQIAYLEKVKGDDQEDVYYSVLIDGHCPLLADGTRSPKYRIRLPGNPILGDGKSDNQNHALIFCRGEYLQLIDANQDNYLEECLKIRNVLAEFEQGTNTSPYRKPSKSGGPVAIVGAREYIFSENIGVLGDIAAGKEQTFGTLSQRIMATIGGKLHYGHPDFLNGVFMTTRGGVSKAQKGLHLNEDIYAGMNAFERGGRIKHVEYFQCGKGRDLGFGSILNFVTKIGTGMGEQMLSREYYYIGTQLPLDRFLTFYYAHPGFHVNNIFIMLSVQLFMIVILVLGALAMPVTLCEFNPDAPKDAPLIPEGCYNLVPVFDWLKRVVISIFVIFAVSFLPLFLQEVNERGFLRAITRLVKQLLSFSPFFEIFVTQCYAQAILSNLSFGGARYIATGRGFATSRVPFSQLYARYADSSTYFAIRSFLILLFGSIVIWMPHLLYFWVTVFALILSPFVFNPHQFALVDFLIDYREFLRWLSRGNGALHASSWIGFCRSKRIKVTGVKRKSTKTKEVQSKANFSVVFFTEIVMPVCFACICTIAYLFVHSMPDGNEKSKTSGLTRIGALSMGPIVLNAAVLGGCVGFSVLLGPLASLCCNVKFGSTVAAVAHTWAVVSFIGFFEALYLLEGWHFERALLGLITIASVQRAISKAITVLLAREFNNGESNQAWWTGRWYGRGLGWYALSQPLREFVCKVIEMTLFPTDFVLAHFILFVLFMVCLVPGIDKWHSLMLFWLRPAKQIRHPVYTLSQRQRRIRTAVLYGIVLVMVCALLLTVLVAPAVLGPHLRFLNNLPLPL